MFAKTNRGNQLVRFIFIIRYNVHVYTNVGKIVSTCTLSTGPYTVTLSGKYALLFVVVGSIDLFTRYTCTRSYVLCGSLFSDAPWSAVFLQEEGRRH